MSVFSESFIFFSPYEKKKHFDVIKVLYFVKKSSSHLCLFFCTILFRKQFKISVYGHFININFLLRVFLHSSPNRIQFTLHDRKRIRIDLRERIERKFSRIAQPTNKRASMLIKEKKNLEFIRKTRRFHVLAKFPSNENISP